MPRKKRKPPIGQILKARRLELDKTQAEVADAAGVNQVDVHRLETGTGITAGKTLRVARVLDLERDNLID